MSSTIPDNVQKATDRALTAMQRHPQHALAPYHRQAIYVALGRLADERGSVHPLSDLERYRARLTLDFLAVHRVLPIWQKVYPNDQWPKCLLELAEGVLDKSVDPEVACVEAREASYAWDQWYDSDDGGYQPEIGAAGPAQERLEPSAYAVCLAAAEALRAVCGMNTFDAGPWYEQDTDADLDSGCTDVALWAADAYAGDLWNPTSSSERRREFWEWWLKEAVPSAWRLSQQPES